MASEIVTAYCDWCHRDIVGLGHAPRMYLISMILLPIANYRQSWRICHDCHEALRRTIARRGKGRPPRVPTE